MADVIFVGDRSLKVEPVQFEDIVAGDEIIHSFLSDPWSKVKMLWGGVVNDFAGVSREWWGDFRWYSEGSGNSFTAPELKETESLIAAEWHGEEEGHALFRVLK